MWKVQLGLVALLGRMQFGFLDLLSPLNICAIYAMFGLRIISPGVEEAVRSSIKKVSEHSTIDENILLTWKPISSLVGAFIVQSIMGIVWRLTLPQVLAIDIITSAVVSFCEILWKKRSFSDEQLAFKPMLLYTLTALFPFIGGTAMLGLYSPALLTHSFVRLSIRLYYPSALTAIISSAIYVNKYGDKAIDENHDSRLLERHNSYLGSLEDKSGLSVN